MARTVTRQKERKAARPPAKAAQDQRPLWISIALAAAVLLVYSGAVNHQFINFDDDAYILNNPPIRNGLTGTGIAWAFSNISYFYWQPLTWISNMIDVQIYGLNAAGHHFTNILIHAANSVLAFWAVLRLTGRLWRSALVAALFALHPLRVESVAWVAERKDVLCAFFWLVSVLLYVRYAEKPDIGRRLAVLAAFVAALMAKPVAVTLPAVLLLLDYWPLKRDKAWSSLFLEKLPMFALSAALSVITVFGQKQMGALQSLQRLPLSQRLLNAIIAYAQYLGKTFWPVHLAILYPLRDHITMADAAPAFLLPAAITAAAIVQRRRQPWILVGWLWFLGVLLPSIGILQAGTQALADRFSYLPHIGLLIALVWTGAELAARWGRERVAALAFAVVLLPVFAGLTWAQTRYWADSVTVTQHAIDVNPRNSVMEHNLGFALEQQGRLKEAIEHYGKSLAIDPKDFAGEYNLGKALLEDGRPAEAEPHFRASIALKPEYASAHYGLATVLSSEPLSREKDMAEIEREFSLSLDGDLPQDNAANAHNNLGVIAAQQGKIAEAEQQFAAAMRLDPKLYSAETNYAQSLMAQHKTEEARAWLTRTLASNGDRAELRRMLDSLPAAK